MKQKAGFPREKTVETKEHVPIRNSIATKLLRVVFSFYLVIAIGVTMVHMVMEYRHQKDDIINGLEGIQKTFEQGIALDMWQLNQESLSSTIEGMLKLPVVVGVRIQDAKDADIAFGCISLSHSL